MQLYHPAQHSSTLSLFTALHGMQTRSSEDNSVRLSVYLSVTRMDCDKTVERSVQIFIPYHTIFWEEEWLVEATTCTWNLGSTGFRWSKIADFEPMIARSASAVTSSEKRSLNANRKSTTRFPMSLRWSSYVALKPTPQRRAQKRKTAIFSLKSHFAWRKSATKCLCVKTVSDKVVRHSFS